MNSCRRLGLNNQILNFTKYGLEGYGRAIGDEDLLKYHYDVLKLCHQEPVSGGRVYALTVIKSLQSIAEAVTHQSMQMVCVHSSCLCIWITLRVFNQACEPCSDY
jgi:hypothetical protein